MKKEDFKKDAVMVEGEIEVVHNGVNENNMESWLCCYGGLTMVL